MLFDLKVTLRLKVPTPSKMAASAALRQALLSSTVSFEDFEIHEIAAVEGNAAEEQLELDVVEASSLSTCASCGPVEDPDCMRECECACHYEPVPHAYSEEAFLAEAGVV